MPSAILALPLVPDVGYVPYVNSKLLGEQFLNTKPWETTDQSLLGPGFTRKASRPAYPSLFYLKQPYDTDASLTLTETLELSTFAEGLFIDNPKDNPTSTLNWYAEKIRDSDGLVVHLLAHVQEGQQRHNLKCAFLAGLGYALHGRVLMLAPDPYDTPMDYRSILHVHATADACRTAVNKWLSQIEELLPKKRPQQLDSTAVTTPMLELRGLRVGEHVAEHEFSSLDNYFVQTSDYITALESEQVVFVGRRGTGKTAILYALSQQLRRRPGTHVCVIKPVGYEVNGIIRVLGQIAHKAEQGYLLESLWKLLIYSELAISIADEVRERGPEQAHLLTDAESRLLEFVHEHQHLLSLPFSIRVDRAISPLLESDADEDADRQRAKISESLHVGVIRDLRDIIGEAMANRSRVAILIDNLDEPWAPGSHIEYLGDLLLGLLRVARDIVEDFHRSNRRRKRINASVVLFIRSDIFYHVQQAATEQDKLPVHVLYWGDREQLLHVIDERLRNAAAGRLSAGQVWDSLFTDSVASRHPRDFVSNTALARPRDLIYLVGEAIATAVNRQHSIVTESDLFDARRRYSEFAFRSILAEDDPRRGQLESVLYEFAGAQAVMTRSEVEGTIGGAGLSKENVDYYFDLLCDLNFLGIEGVDGFRYPRHEGDRRLWRKLARKAATRRGGPHSEELYQINDAFHDVLEIR